jgi:hypothetical protein
MVWPWGDGQARSCAGSPDLSVGLAAHALGGQERDPRDEGSAPCPIQAWVPNLLKEKDSTG